MTLQAGTRLGPYEITAPLGAGGMGEVYRAQDSRFGREVAIKVLPSSLSDDPDRLQRFEQEARAAGILNHPNILSVYDIGQSNGSPYLVSELLEGETLRQKIGREGVAYRKALDYSLQITRGLFAAHEKGIVHRDLKPENIFVTKDGRVKILDFGLAKLTQQEIPAGQLTQLPTTPGTEPGLILGTIGYMSPEQVRGKSADARSDIFAFGAILYELLTGQKAFRGETAADTMSAILQKDPPEITQTSRNGSPALSRIVQHCIEKDPEQRFQSASDIAFAIESLSSVSETTIRSAVAAPSRKIWSRLWNIISVVGILGVLVLSFLYYRVLSIPKTLLRAAIESPEGESYSPDDGGMSLSPDGRNLAFVSNAFDAGKKRIWLRTMDQPSARPLPETENGFWPFWSPDSQWIAFFANGKLKKVSIGGGPAQTICDAAEGRGGAWSRNGIILFAPSPYGPLFKVSASGGKPEQVTQKPPAPNISHRWPIFLPDGTRFLFLEMDGKPEGIYAGTLESQKVQHVLADATNVAYASPGYLLFHREGNLIAQRYNVDEGKVEGEPLVVLPEKIDFVPAKRLASFAISNNGILAYWPEFSPLSRLTWVDRMGNRVEAPVEPFYSGGIQLSPDGQKALVNRYDRQIRDSDLWIYELSNGRNSRITFQANPTNIGIWSRDQKFVVYNTGRNIYKKSISDGTEQLLLSPDRWLIVTDVSPDGKWVLCGAQSPRGDHDLWMIPTDGSKKVQIFLETPFHEGGGRFSPDGKWIGYESNSSGQMQVHVRPSDGSNRQWQVTSGESNIIKWRNDGKELYYFAGTKVFSVAVSADTEFKYELGHPIYNFPENTIGGDISPDGQRALMVLAENKTIAIPFQLVLNWTETLKKTK